MAVTERHLAYATRAVSSEWTATQRSPGAASEQAAQPISSPSTPACSSSKAKVAGSKSDAYQIYNRPTAQLRAVLARVYASRRQLNSVFDRHDFFRGIP